MYLSIGERRVYLHDNTIKENTFVLEAGRASIISDSESTVIVALIGYAVME